MSTSVSPVTATNSIYTPADTNERVAKKVMDQDDFLKLLVTQFTNQDPMSPMQDTSYIAQMAQFTSLEQTKQMSSDISSLKSQNELLQANALIGRTVNLQIDTDKTATGIVDAVAIKDGQPQIVVNGQAYELSKVLNITQATQKTQS